MVGASVIGILIAQFLIVILSVLLGWALGSRKTFYVEEEEEKP